MDLIFKRKRTHLFKKSL